MRLRRAYLLRLHEMPILQSFARRMRARCCPRAPRLFAGVPRTSALRAQVINNKHHRFCFTRTRDVAAAEMRARHAMMLQRCRAGRCRDVVIFAAAYVLPRCAMFMLA